MNKKEDKTIIIIDDDLNVHKKYGQQLQDSGYKVINVANPEYALEKAQSGADLILLDIMMPKINGFQLLKQFKSNRKLQKIPVIVFTNITNKVIADNKQIAMLIGAEDYLIKSKTTPLMIIEKIKSILKNDRIGNE